MGQPSPHADFQKILTLMYLTSQLIDDRRRDRVAKACALCRRKKIKCDGMVPCNHCQNLNSTCFYELAKQRKPREKITDNLLDRLGKLEELVLGIANKMDTLVSIGSVQHAQIVIPSLLLLRSTASGGGSSPEEAEDTDDSADPQKSLVAMQTKESFFEQCKAVMTETFEDDVTLSTRETQPHFKGAHLGFSMLFSPQSISFIRLKLLPQDHYITVPLESLLYYNTAWKRVFLSVWTEPQVQTADQIKRLKVGIFPHNRALMDEFLQIHKECEVAMICPPELAKELFDSYYDNKSLPSEKRRKFLYSELMIMNLVIAISASLCIDNKNPLGEGHRLPVVEKISVTELSSLQEEVFMNSIFYYNRISAVSEGVMSVQALLLMVVYLESCWVISDVNFTLVGTAVRYAQELGLHRIETTAHLPELERFQRIKLWSLCQHMDIDMCYRLGKPPLVNIVDVSVLNSFNNVSISDHAQVIRKAMLVAADKFSVVEQFLHFNVFRLCQIQSLSYVKLFSASVEFDSMNRVQEIVNSINSNLFEMALQMPEDCRPRFYYEENFDKLSQTIRTGRNSDLGNVRSYLLLGYFSHLMTVNRVPCQVVTNESEKPSSENSEFRRLSFESARTILHIVRNIDKERFPHIEVNWLVSFPFSAAINILSNCMNHSNGKETLKDLSLIIDLSINFFGYFGLKAENEHTRLLYMRLQIIDLLIRILLRITIKIVEEGGSINILGSNPALKEHLEVIERKYPQFYRKAEGSEAVSSLMKSICPKFYPKLHRDIKNDILNDLPSNNSSNTVSSYVSTPKHTDPAIPNILHPTESKWENDVSQMPNWQFGDDFFNLASEEMSGMPNYFFDNGL